MSSSTTTAVGAPTQATAEIPAPAKPRIAGIDLARGLAVIGMFAAHAGPPDPQNWLHQLVSGRSAVLFAVLAGVSVALLSGGRSGPGDRRGRMSSRIAVRAVVLFALGLALTSLQVPAMVILTSYGVLFLLSIPLLRLGSRALAVLAGITAVVTPLVSYGVRSAMPPAKEIGYVPGFSAFSSLEETGRAVQGILLDGAYPVLTWIPFLLVGMALGRMDLRAVRARLVAIGTGLAVLGYGISWLAMEVFGGFDHLAAQLNEQLGGQLPPEMVRLVLDVGYGTVSTTSPVNLLSSGAHSGSPLEIIGSGGVAIAVLGLCLLTERLPRVLLQPVASIGALSLTAYAGHLLVLRAFGPEQLQGAQAEHPYLLWLALVVAAAVVCTAWRTLLGRGPLEWLVHQLSRTPERLVAPRHR